MVPKLLHAKRCWVWTTVRLNQNQTCQKIQNLLCGTLFIAILKIYSDTFFAKSYLKFVTGSPTKEAGSPTRSPIKSPRKGHRSKARDVLTLPKPYSGLKSDQIKRWNKEMLDGKVIGADNEAELELFKTIFFTNALVLKTNQLAKQVRDLIFEYFSAK